MTDLEYFGIGIGVGLGMRLLVAILDAVVAMFKKDEREAKK